MSVEEMFHSTDNKRIDGSICMPIGGFQNPGSFFPPVHPAIPVCNVTPAFISTLTGKLNFYPLGFDIQPRVLRVDIKLVHNHVAICHAKIGS